MLYVYGNNSLTTLASDQRIYVACHSVKSSKEPFYPISGQFNSNHLNYWMKSLLYHSFLLNLQINGNDKGEILSQYINQIE